MLLPLLLLLTLVGSGSGLQLRKARENGSVEAPGPLRTRIRRQLPVDESALESMDYDYTSEGTEPPERLENSTEAAVPTPHLLAVMAASAGPESPELVAWEEATGDSVGGLTTRDGKLSTLETPIVPGPLATDEDTADPPHTEASFTVGALSSLPATVGVPLPATTEALSVEPTHTEALSMESTHMEPLSTVPVATEALSTVPVATEALTTVPGATEALTTVPGATEALSTVPGATEALSTVPGATEALSTVPGATEALSTVPGATEALSTGLAVIETLSTEPAATAAPATEPATTEALSTDLATTKTLPSGFANLRDLSTEAASDTPESFNHNRKIRLSSFTTSTATPSPTRAPDYIPVKQCLLAILILALVATTFLVCTVVLAVRLSRKSHMYPVRDYSPTEMVCISALLPEGGEGPAASTANGSLPNAKSQEQKKEPGEDREGDDLTLHSFLP